MIAKVFQRLVEELLDKMQGMDAVADEESLFCDYSFCRACARQLLASGTLSEPVFKALSDLLAEHYRLACDALAARAS